ncbi:MAG: DNA polymerase III subunit delta [Proteobacteria bacterium]|nr:DNA polymerase III subunit delta [Pseudomonadota bacterium]
MKAEELLRKLRDDVVDPLYFIYGNDEFLKQQSVSKIKAIALQGGMADFNFDLFHAGEADMSKIMSVLSTFPVMAKRRLVILKDADKLKSQEREVLLPYFNDPSPTTTLLMIGGDVDKRKTFFSTLVKKGALVEHNHPYEREMPKWINWIAKKKGFEISDNAARCLVDIVGNDLSSVANEIEKASIYIGDKGNRIELEAIEAVTIDMRERTVFQLIDALGKKNLKKSLENLKRLLDGGESPLLILNLIVRQLRLIWMGLDIMKRGGGESEVRLRVKLPPFVFKDYLKQIKLFKEEELREAYDRLFDLDLKFKSSPIDKERALELLVFKLCS